MSLSSFLLSKGDSDKGKGKSIDNDLFSSTVKAPTASVTSPAAKIVSVSTANPSVPIEKKRKLLEEPSVPSSSKRSKPRLKDTAEPTTTVDHKKKKQNEVAKLTRHAEESEDELEHSVPPTPTSSKKSSKMVKRRTEEESSDDEGDPSNLVHESLTEGGRSREKARVVHTKFVPEGETSAQRDARTIFVGNVSAEVAKSRPLLKQLKRHILSHVPSAKIESVRLRSVGFQKPTAPLAEADSKAKRKEGDSEGRQHDRDRAATWRAKQQGDDAEEVAAAPEKKFLSTSEKKRVAFINHEIHAEVDSVNAYIVFAHPTPEDGSRASNLPPVPKAMDPYEAAKLAVNKCDGTTFLERTIRVDIVGQGVHGVATKGGDLGGDPRLAIFVGNLDFASKEEDVRVFFESLLTTERGPPPEADSDDEDEGTDRTASRSNYWVKRVRIIRDKDTLLGKGFGYVQFVDRECVDEILSLEETRLKFAKRKLRVQRCKTVPGSKTKIPSSTAAAAAMSSKTRGGPPPLRPVPSGPAPKGDPDLGTKISHLSKEERKNVKKTDADRVARRLAKKAAKSKMALVEKGVKSKTSDRERARKKPRDAKVAVSKGKRRVRSDKAISKMNTKKL